MTISLNLISILWSLLVHTIRVKKETARQNYQAPVVQRLDNAIHRLNRYPVDMC